MPQPTWVLMQAVRRSFSWMRTHSIETVVGQPHEQFVRVVAGGLVSFDPGAERDAFCASDSRRERGKSVICSKLSARPATTQRRTWRTRLGLAAGGQPFRQLGWREFQDRTKQSILHGSIVKEETGCRDRVGRSSGLPMERDRQISNRRRPLPMP